MRRGLVCAGLMVGAAVIAAGQAKEVISNGGLNHTLQAPPVIGQPYSAEQVQDHSRQLPDGTKIEHAGHHFVARDSAGRVRVEQPCGCAPDHEQIIEVFVLDPVAHTLTTWRTGGNSPKIASVAKLSEHEPADRTPEPKPVRTANTSRPQPIVTTAQLPDELIDNLRMAVIKTTTIVPAGRSGNDQPITKTHTVWTSEDLKLTFKEVWEDPRNGARVVGLVKFSRAEPDARMFRVPGGYQVKDAKESLKELAQRLEQSPPSM